MSSSPSASWPSACRHRRRRCSRWRASADVRSASPTSRARICSSTSNGITFSARCVRTGGNKKAAAQDARPEPPRALPPARAPRALGNYLPPPAVGDARGVRWRNCARLWAGQNCRRRRPPAAEGRRSVLIVDDEPGVRHLMRRWLESRGYAVAVAPGADQALELLADDADGRRALRPPDAGTRWPLAGGGAAP